MSQIYQLHTGAVSLAAKSDTAVLLRGALLPDWTLDSKDWGTALRHFKLTVSYTLMADLCFIWFPKTATSSRMVSTALRICA